jgi:hypothetical protein
MELMKKQLRQIDEAMRKLNETKSHPGDAPVK